MRASDLGGAPAFLSFPCCRGCPGCICVLYVPSVACKQRKLSDETNIRHRARPTSRHGRRAPVGLSRDSRDWRSPSVASPLARHSCQLHTRACGRIFIRLFFLPCVPDGTYVLPSVHLSGWVSMSVSFSPFFKFDFALMVRVDGREGKSHKTRRDGVEVEAIDVPVAV